MYTRTSSRQLASAQEGCLALPLEEALDSQDLDAAHGAWMNLAEACIEVLRGKSDEAILNQIAEAPSRTAPPSFRKQRITVATNGSADPSTHRQRQLHNARNRLTEVRAKLERWQKDLGR